MLKMQVTGNVIQASRFNVEGNTGGKIILTNMPSEQNENRAGLDIMEIKADYEIVDKLKQHLPCDCDITMEPIQGGGGKGTFKLIDIRPKKAS